MKKIAIDISYYWKMSGFWVVTNNLLKRILENDKENYFYLVSNEKKHLSELKDLKNWEFINTKTKFIIHKFFKLPFYLKKYRIDTYFSFDQELPLRKVCKYVCIFHDIWAIALWKRNILKQLFTKWTDKLDRIYHLTWFEKRAARKADSIFCPSNRTKQDLIKYFKINNDKITVINRWVDHIRKDVLCKKKKDYILFPFSNLYDDFQYHLANEIIDKKIVNKIIFLRPSYLINKEIKLSKNIDIINYRIPQDELEKFYWEAQLSIYLSDYDWFGFVPLESALMWTPVICNKISCIPEIMWNLWIVGGLEICLWIGYINKLLKGNNLKELLVKQINNANKYSWDKIVGDILNSFN